MNDLISVIVPVFNTKEYLEKCIDSILNQTYKNIEIILVDDGSSDGSDKVCDSYCKKDQRVKAIHKKNGGLSDARNVGINEARGTYISFIDSDDYIENNMYEYLLSNMTSNNTDIGICGWYLVNGKEVKKSKFVREDAILDREQCIDELLSNNSFDNFMCNKIFKKSLFENIEFPVGRKLEDLATLYKVIDNANKIFVSSKPFYYYVMRDDSITSTLNKKIDVNVFNEYIIRKDNLLKEYPKLKKKILSNYFTACRMNLINSINSSERNIDFEKLRIKDMRGNVIYIWTDKSLSFRNKISFSLSTICPYLFFKIRFRRR